MTSEVKRWRIDEVERDILMEQLREGALPSSEQISSLAVLFDVPPRKIQTWFQNARQRRRSMSPETCRVALLGILICDVFAPNSDPPSAMQTASEYVASHTSAEVEDIFRRLLHTYCMSKRNAFPMAELDDEERETLYLYALLDKFVQVTAP